MTPPSTSVCQSLSCTHANVNVGEKRQWSAVSKEITLEYLGGFGCWFSAYLLYIWYRIFQSKVVYISDFVFDLFSAEQWNFNLFLKNVLIAWWNRSEIWLNLSSKCSLAISRYNSHIFRMTWTLLCPTGVWLMRLLSAVLMEPRFPYNDIHGCKY